MRKTIGIFLFSVIGYTAWGQPQVTGTVHIGAETTPAKETIVTDLDYLSSGHHYRLEEENKPVYYGILYGLDMKLRFQQAHSLRLMLDGVFNQGKNMGNRTESVHDINGTLLSQLRSTYRHPNAPSHHLSALAAYEGVISQQGSIAVSYRYHIDNERDQLHQQITEQMGFTRFESNDYTSQAREEEHEVDIHYRHTFPFTDGTHRFTVGGRYDYRQLVQEQMQAWDDVAILNDTFTHRTHYGAVYAGYQVQYKPLTAMAQLEYRYSRMQQQNLHDVLPMARIAWQVRPEHTVSAQYGIRLVRPMLMHINPAHVRGAYTDNYGVNTIVGTHVHRVSVDYAWEGSSTDFHSSLYYLTAKDGFNSIWIENNDIRISWWGNDGVRHAVGLTPAVDWKMADKLQVHAEATVLWDKRMALAINTQSQHVGIAAQLRLNHHLVKGFSWGAHCNYSYGNTIDLYSYAGHGVKTGVKFHAQWLPQKNLHLTVRYDYVVMPSIHITTPVSYTGTIVTQAPNRHEIALMLSFDF